MKRRSFIKSALVVSATGAAVTGGLLSSQTVLAASHEMDLTKAKSFDEAMKMMGATDAAESDMIKIKAPEIAENGAVVPVSIASDIEGTTEIIALISNNPVPYAAKYTMGAKAKAAVKSRFKMAKTSDVVAVVKANDKFYMAKSNIKVTKGGCGG
ncbi:MAG: sulfur-oxidizing protein SoxY [Cocleimonas sp.]|jgi:sulfur-oxidizing protein SoxY